MHKYHQALRPLVFQSRIQFPKMLGDTPTKKGFGENFEKYDLIFCVEHITGSLPERFVTGNIRSVNSKFINRPKNVFPNGIFESSFYVHL